MNVEVLPSLPVATTSKPIKQPLINRAPDRKRRAPESPRASSDNVGP